MRLSDDQIADLTLHADANVRQTALNYFAQAFQGHPRLLPNIQQGMEKFGPELLKFWDWFTNLPLPEEFIPWVAEQGAESEDGFADVCRSWLFTQDATVLKRHESLWRSNPHVDEATTAWLERRLTLLDLSGEDAWQELGKWATEIVSSGVNEAEIENAWEADCLAEVVRRHETPELRAKVRAVVEQCEDDPSRPNYFLLPWATRLAGQWRIAECAAPIVKYDLETQTMLTFDEASDALARIGGDAVSLAIIDAWETGVGDVTGLALHLEFQRGPAAIAAALQFARESAADDVLRPTADGLLCQFDQEAGEKLLAELQGEKLEPCAEALLAWATGLGLEHPDRLRWQAAKEAFDERAEHHHCGPGCGHEHEHEHEDHHEHEHCGPGCDHEHHHHADEDEAVAEDTDTIRNEQVRVGRNGPCPCGSGKKFKKCCGKVGAEAAGGFDLDF